MDISMVIMRLNIKPGDKVCESGTGSGSLSYSISQNVGEKGKLFTFEFNQQR
jgi:tRNA (adenine57-N1/adenine58-N1)-methyltransferase